MNEIEIENGIRDSTNALPIEERENDGDIREITCAGADCSNVFLEFDEGVSATLKRCKKCYEKLKEELSPPSSGTFSVLPAAGESDTIPKMSLVHEGTEDENGDRMPLPPPSAIQETLALNLDSEGITVTMEMLEGAIINAIKGKEKMFSVRLNGTVETYVLSVDVINGSSTRKLFIRTSLCPILYWYKVFGAMSVQRKGVVICPCVVTMKGREGEILVLVAILETRCNSPRYDALIYVSSCQQCTLIKGGGVSLGNSIICHPERTFDSEAVERFESHIFYYV